MKTKYRKIHNGHWNFLQYKKEFKFLYFFKITKWFYVWKPYYHTFWGRQLDATDTKCLVNDFDNLDDFIIKWPNIDDYFMWAEKEQTKFEDIAYQERKAIDDKKGKIIEM